MGRPIVAVGTTSVRLLETLYWLGVKLLLSQQSNPSVVLPAMELEQWEPYALAAQGMKALPFPAADALRAVCANANGTVVRGATSLCIVPGYKFAV